MPTQQPDLHFSIGDGSCASSCQNVWPVKNDLQTLSMCYCHHKFYCGSVKMSHNTCVAQIGQKLVYICYLIQEICGIVHVSNMPKISTFRAWLRDTMQNHVNPEFQKDAKQEC